MIKRYFKKLLRSRTGQQGISLIEVLLALLLIGLISLGIASNTISSMHIQKKTEENYAASNLALSKVEQLSAIPVDQLSSANNSVEESLKVPGSNATFRRSTTIVVNADTSRTITVKVETVGAMLPTKVNFKTTFSMWQ
ncbi:MAG: hypothetical protein GX589_05040 [Deltaproteobacteria bacterium]|nr:hypothetical protein [Deltaproteobacteria bacterium]